MFPLSDSIKSKRFPFVNVTLIAVTVFVFVNQLMAPDELEFIYTYALVPANIDFVNFSTLFPFVTSIFLHGGFLHIISNMWFLWIFGDNVEGRIGIILFPVLYLMSGIFGSLAQYVVMPGSDIPMLGASGAVAGILGAYFVFFPRARIRTLIPFFGFYSVIEVSAPFMLGYWFILQVISGAVSLPFSGDGGGVAFWAHVGGFVLGYVFARLYTGVEYKK